MILVLAGTSEGRALADLLQKHDFNPICSVVSEYGEVLLRETGISNVVVHRLDTENMTAFIQKHDVSIVVDATHPFAVNISNLAQSVCRQLNIIYLRFQRYLDRNSELEGVNLVPSYQEAAHVACQLGKRIFLTTGSNHLDTFVQAAQRCQCQIIARVLPEPAVLAKCRDLGLMPRDVIAIQGPFSKDLNVQLMLHSKAQVLVTKNSGATGGFRDKVQAAQELNISVVVIQPPEETCIDQSLVFTDQSTLLAYLSTVV